MKASKPPLREVASDAITVTVDDVEYHPHAGERVWFRPGASSNAMRLILKLQALQKATLTSDEAAAFGALLQEAATYIASAVVRWDWTDINGDPMPPITPESAINLDLEEVMWLLTASVKGISEAASKNASTPSTESSPGAVEA